MRNDTRAFLELFLELIWNSYVTKRHITSDHSHKLTDLQQHVKKNGTSLGLASGVRNSHPSTSYRHRNSNKHKSKKLLDQHKEETSPQECRLHVFVLSP